MGTVVINAGSPQATSAAYVYVPFDVFPFIGFGNDFTVECGSGVRHVVRFSLALSSFTNSLVLYFTGMGQ